MLSKKVFFLFVWMISQLSFASNWEDDCGYLIKNLGLGATSSTAPTLDAFNEKAINTALFQSIKVANKQFEIPVSFGELLEYLDGINSSVKSHGMPSRKILLHKGTLLQADAACPLSGFNSQMCSRPAADKEKEKTTVFQYGNNAPITLRLPAIGEGKHTLVYDIVSQNAEQASCVLKLTKPDTASLRATMVDIKLSSFWLNFQAEHFYVPKYIEVHHGGVFRIVEKCDGISLTKMLLYLRLLSFDDTYYFGETASSSAKLNHCFSSNAKQQALLKVLERGVMEIVTTVQNNPEHCPSLSPNNIYVTYTEGEDIRISGIKKTVFVDIGVSNDPAKKIKEYEHLRMFDDYLELAAKSLKSYLKSRDYQYDFDSMCEWLRAGRSDFSQDFSRG